MLFAALIAGAVLLSPSLWANNTPVTYLYDNEFSNGTAPTGPAPWLEARFSDVAGGVQLTLMAQNLSSTEFVSGWYFNLNPLLVPTQLSFAYYSGGTATILPVQTGLDAFKADGDGKYDILITFPTSGTAAQRFSAGDSITFTVTGITGLTASDFEFQSAPSGGHGPFFSAAHVQGISGDLSGWVDPSGGNTGASTKVPDGGSTIALLGSALLGLGVLGRKLRWV